MSTLKEKIEQLLKARKAISDYEEQIALVIKPLKAEKEKLQNEILEEMKANDQPQTSYVIDGNKVSVSKKVKRTLQIVDNKKVVDYLTAHNLDNEYVETTVNGLFWDSMAKSIIKDGNLIDGTSFKETEFISLTNNKIK